MSEAMAYFLRERVLDLNAAAAAQAIRFLPRA